MSERELTDRYLELLEHPEKMGEEELRVLLEDPQMRELTEQMDFAKRAFENEVGESERVIDEVPDVDEEWEKFAASHFKEENRVRPIPIRVRRIIWATAATVILAIGIWSALWTYQERMLENRYGGSYMIVDGRRIDDLRKISPQIKQALSLADAYEVNTASDFINQAEQDLLQNIQNDAERERVRQLLNK